MRKYRFAAILLITSTLFFSCACECINCPGYASSTGAASDNICRTEYEASGAAYTLSWQNYSQDMVKLGGCSCKN